MKLKRILLAIGLLTVASVLNADGNNSDYVGYGDDSNVGVVTKRARAQFGTPGKLLSGDALGVFQSYGYNGSAFVGPKGSIEIQANQNWSSTANGTKILFKTTPDGSTTQATTLTLDDDGNLTTTGYLTMYTRTSAQIKVTTPTAVGQTVFDTTLNQPVFSTGTATWADWVTATGTRPSGY